MQSDKLNGANAPHAPLSAHEMEYLPDEIERDGLPAEHEAELKRLIALTPLQYGQQRKEAAEKLNVSVSYLDRLCKMGRSQGDDAAQGRRLDFTKVMPWGEPVNGEELLDEIVDVVRRFVICKPHAAQAAALWVTFTWFMDVVRVSPIAIITAPEKRCGKTVLLGTMAKLVARPLLTSGITASALFRVIEMHGPTLLIDEADVVLKENEALRGVLNSGHTRDTAVLIRSVGDEHEPRQFSTWGAKLIAGISANLLADTVTDRSVVLELRRKTNVETVERLRHADPALFVTLNRKLARWAADNSDTVRRAVVDVPDELNDRAQDNWEPLLAIADVAAGKWPEIARQCAVATSGKGDEVTATVGTELLESIRKVFIERDIARISMTELLDALYQEPESRWASYSFGKPLSARQLGKLLSSYNIKSKAMRRDADTTYKGYDAYQFAEAFLSYLPQEVKKEPVAEKSGNTGNSVTHPF